jgi:hypothetical protein
VLRNMRSVISSICRGSKAGSGQGSGGRPLALRVDGTGYRLGRTKRISLEVRLVGIADDNIPIESTWAMRILLILVSRTDHIPCGHHRAKGYFL